MSTPDYNARPRRLRLNMLAGFSMVLCILTGVMWVRSYFVTDYYRDETEYGYRVDTASEDGYVAQWVIRIGSRTTEHAWLEHHPEGISLQVRLTVLEHVPLDGDRRILAMAPANWADPHCLTAYGPHGGP
jgi:hypothetical protein